MNAASHRHLACLLLRSRRASVVLFQRPFSVEPRLFQQAKPSSEDKLVRAADDAGPPLSTHVTGARRAKQAAKDASYGAVIVAGGLLVVATGYYLLSELFSRETPSGIYDESSKMCLENFEVREALGTPIKVTAESGGRRVFQIKHKFYIEDGQLYLIINYYLEGQRNKGTVFCKVKKADKSGKFEYEHVIVKLDHPHRGNYRIVVKEKDAAAPF